MIQTSLCGRVPRLWVALTVGLVAFALASFQGGVCEDDKTVTLLDEWGNPVSNAGPSAFRFVGYQLKPFCKYEKKDANLAELCKTLKDDQISFDEFLGVDVSKLDQKSRWAYQRGTPTVVKSNAEVISALRKSKAVSFNDWHHKYHHVAHKDQHGYITTTDGTKIIWMLRPGGLGVLVYPDGGTIFTTTATDKAGRFRQVAEPVSAREQDILETVAKRPLGTQVKAKDGSWKPAKYGDPKLAAAVEHLAFIPKPWTVPSITQKYHALKEKNDQTCAHLLRVLAASRDPRAATVLGPALTDGSLAIRVAATYGIMDYFMDQPVNGGTEQHMEAAQQWWQQQQTKAKAKSDNRPLRKTAQ